MRYQTHVITSITAAVVLHNTMDLPLSIGVLAGVAVGSLLPDIDEPESYIGQRTRGVSDLIKLIFGHRGFTHSLLAALLAFFPYIIMQYPNLLGIEIPALLLLLKPFFYGTGMGYMLHIAGDMFSKSGVPLLLPFSKKNTSIYLYKTGDMREIFIRYATLGYLIWMMVTGNVLSEVFTF